MHFMQAPWSPLQLPAMPTFTAAAGRFLCGVGGVSRALAFSSPTTASSPPLCSISTGLACLPHFCLPGDGAPSPPPPPSSALLFLASGSPPVNTVQASLTSQAGKPCCDQGSSIPPVLGSPWPLSEETWAGGGVLGPHGVRKVSRPEQWGPVWVGHSCLPV